MQNDTKFVDGFRFVSNLNTTVRYLNIISQIIRFIGQKQLPKQILKSTLIEWSRQQEQESIAYKKHHGKITENGKPTSAFEHYLDFSSSLGLIIYHGDLLRLSRLGVLLNKLLDESKEIKSEFSEVEKLFFIIILFRNDADAILLTLDLLHISFDPTTQESLFKKFKSYLIERLLIKQKYANETIQSIIRERYRIVEYEWKNAESYAKHIIPPRLEWMADLGLLNRIKEGNKTHYQINNLGQQLIKTCLIFPNSEIHDVNESWLQNHAINSFIITIKKQGIIRKWLEIADNKRINLIITYLEKTFNFFNFEGAMRISLYHAFLYMIINLAVNENILVEIDDLLKEFKNSIVVGNRKYSIRSSTRINEGYITVNLI